MRLERMQPRPDKLLWLSRHPPKESTYDLEEARSLAQSLLDRMDEARARLGGSGIVLSEGITRHQQIVKEWRRLASRRKLVAAASGEVEELAINLWREGGWGVYADDPLAGDGRALKIFGTHHEWAAQFPMSNIEFEPGAKYRLRARIRVEKAAVSNGELRAFNAGVYDPDAKEKVGGIEPRLSDVGDGYAWFDVATWKPNGREIFYLAPPWFGSDVKSPISAVWLDKLEISLVK
jgi:hypothetical protein